MSVAAQKLPSYALCTPEEAEEYARDTKEGHWNLLPHETFWRERYIYLESKGYKLRPRFDPTWTPSWLGTNRDPDFCEDSVISMKSGIIDATRLSDGVRVMIKSVSRIKDEAPIARFLTSGDLLQDPTNHCVPVFDVVDDPHDASKAMMVMQYLRPFDKPEFRTIGEVVDFVAQTLEGLCFIHSHLVAHRDCAAANIMMDASHLFPKGHHPVRLEYTADAVFDAPHLTRSDHPVKYYFVDFGLSSRFKPDESPLVVGTKGRDKEPPELSDRQPYNPFPLDIFILGNLYLKGFLEKYHGLDFLEPLVGSMIHRQPDQRPTAQSAHQSLREIRTTLGETTLRWRLRSRQEGTSERVVYDTIAVAREGLYQLKRMMMT